MKAISAVSAICVLSMLSLSLVAAPPGPSTRTGTVLNVIDVENYTYLEVALDESVDKTPVWLAGPTTPVKAGAAVHFDEDMPMTDFHSDKLNRTFANIFFVSHIEVVDKN